MKVRSKSFSKLQTVSEMEGEWHNNNYEFTDALGEYSYLSQNDQHSEEIKIILEKSLDISDSLVGSQNKASRYLLQRLGDIYLKKGTYKIAERLLKRAEKAEKLASNKNLYFLATLKSDFLFLILNIRLRPNW